jgi:hypothetical protein
MSDYLSCPTCRGRGLIRLEDAQAVEAHADQEHRDRQLRAWAHQVEMLRQDNEMRRREQEWTPEQLREYAERRLAELERSAAVSAP